MVTSPSMQDEVAFLTGVKADGTLTPTSYWGWNGDNPATYNSTWTSARKWGTPTAGTAGGTVDYYFDPGSNWSATEQAQLASGLALWAAVANISFVQTTDSSKAQITFTRGHDGGAYTYTIYNGTVGSCLNGGTTLGTIVSAPVSIDTSVAGFGPINGNFSTYGGYPIETFIHEEGHALGLGHAGPYNGSVNTGTQQFSAFDTRQWSLMSYINPGGSAKFSSQYSVTGTNWGGAYPTTLMPLDILAIQRLYGVAVNTPLGGGQTFGFNCNIDPSIKQYFDFTVNKKPIITIWDKGTNNTLDLSGFSSASTINLNAGTFSSTAGLTNNIGIAFDTAVDKLVCSAGANTVTCNNDGDTIIGGTGNDLFIGGTGNDVFNGGGGTNTVKYSGSYSSYTVSTDANGTTTISGGGAGIDTLTNITNVQFSDQTITLGTLPLPTSTSNALPTPRDFNGDGKSDLLMGSTGNNYVQIWQMDGRTLQSSKALAGPGGDWSTVLTGDFNGDGNADVVWQNTSTSALRIWTMDGATRASSTLLSSIPGAGWNLVATGDFNGDGNADLVLENGSQVQMWLMNGASKLSSSTIATPAPGGFEVVGIGDFNGDGSTDILWQNPTTGALDIWLMNGTSLASDNLLATNPGSSWRAVGSGDFNGDGKSDILLQDSSTGQTAIWLMDGTNKLAGSGNLSSNLGSAWKAVNVGDYNGDGMSDVLFRNSGTGAYTVWMMSGTAIQSASGGLSANPGTSWHALADENGVVAPAATTLPTPASSNESSNWKTVATAGYSTDGNSDVLFHNPFSGQFTASTMPSTTSMSGGVLSSNPGTYWHAVTG